MKTLRIVLKNTFLNALNDKDEVVASNDPTKILEGLPLLPELKDENIEKLACDHADKEGLLEMEWHHRAKGFYDGYKAADRFSREDMEACFWAGVNKGQFGLLNQMRNDNNKIVEFDEYIQSLTNYPIAIEVDGSLPVEEQFKNGKYVYNNTK